MKKQPTVKSASASAPAATRAPRRTPATPPRKAFRPGATPQRISMAAAMAASAVPATAPLQGVIRIDLNGSTFSSIAAYLLKVRDGLTENVYYPAAEDQVGVLTAAYDAVISDLEIATALENELKSVRARLEQSMLQGKDLLRNTARYCEAWDSSDEALTSVGWNLRRSPGPAQPLPCPAGLVMQPGANPGQVRARWAAVPNRYFYDIQVFNSASQPNPVNWNDVPVIQDIRVVQLFSGYPSASFLTVRIRANGSRGPGPWCDPLTARVP